MSRGFWKGMRNGVAGSVAVTALLLSGAGPVASEVASAGATTSVTAGPVTVTNGTAGASTTYSIGFRTSSSGSLGGTNSSITFTAPSGTLFPSCALLNCSAYSVSPASGSATIGSANVNGSTVQINLALASISASDAVTVTITGVTNPTLASTGDTIEESTSSDTAPVATANPYDIVPGAVASATAVSGGGQTAKVGSSFQNQLVVVLRDKFNNTEPAGTPVAFSAPSCGSPPCASATFANGSVNESVTTGADGAAGSGPVTANDGAGTYSVTASANSLSATFGLRNVFPVVPGSVTVLYPQAGASTVYSAAFTTSSAGGCTTACSIDFVGPTGTVFPSTPASYSVAVGNHHSATVGSVSAPAGSNSVSIGLSGSTIAAGDSVTVTISGVGNPTAAGAAYTIQESTSTDAAPAASQPYSITASAPALIQPLLGDLQHAMAFNPFPSPLIAVVTDAFGNPVPGAQVTFTAPGSMNGALFASCDGGNPSAAECLSTTDGSGYAYAPELVAGASSGIYNVAATSGSAQPAYFALTVLQSGYWMVASDGGLFNHGGAPFDGSEGGTHLNKPIVGMSAAPNGGYYMVASDGGVFTFGGAPFYGSTGNIRLNSPVVGMAVDPQTGGYWLVASDGGIFNFNAPFYGSEGGTHLNKPIVGMAATPQGGYYLVASDGGIFNFGPGATFYGSEGGTPLNQPIVGMAESLDGGYYMVARDGGVFNFGPGAPYLGSASGRSYAPVVGMAIDPASGGYWIAASNGAVFNFGGAPFSGDQSAHPVNQPIVGIASSAGA